jgi:hypothetical protein
MSHEPGRRVPLLGSAEVLQGGCGDVSAAPMNRTAQTDRRTGEHLLN